MIALVSSLLKTRIRTTTTSQPLRPRGERRLSQPAEQATHRPLGSAFFSDYLLGF